MLFQIILTVVLAASQVSSDCLKNATVGVWEPASSPEDAFIVGKETTDTYFCRSPNGLDVGKCIIGDKICYVERAGAEVRYTANQFDLLADVGQVVWTPVVNIIMPCNLVQLGSSPAIPLFAGRVLFATNKLMPGKVIDGTLTVTSASRIYKYTVFEALTAVPQKVALSARQSSTLFATDSRYLSFKVRSGDAVTVDFGARNQKKYRLTIGTFGNRMSGIGPMDDPLQSFEKTDNILDPNELKGFWVRWVSNNLIEFGVEGVLNPLVKFSDDDVFTINTVVFSSGSHESFWQIPELLQERDF